MRVDTLIAGGTVVTGSGSAICDVAIKDGRIVGLTDPALRPDADRYVDATGKIVMPGVIDVHVHFAGGMPNRADSLYDVTVSGAYGGVTTIIGFAQGEPTEPMRSYLPRIIAEGRERAAIDFAFHAMLMPQANDLDQIPEAIRLGVTSFKMMMTYRPQGRMFTDDLILKVMDLAARHGGLAQVHAEHGDVIDYLVERYQREGHIDPTWYPKSQPGFIEVEAINRATMLAEVTGCPLYIVHISTGEGLDAATRAKARSGRVYTETLPKYLVLDDSEMERQGPFAKIGPPLRPASELPGMVARLQANLFDVVASDHAPYTAASKQVGYENIFKAPFGAAGIETLLTVMYGEFVATGKLRPEQLVRMLCEHPAQIFGLYPRKGSLRVGADADVVLIDPTIEWTITHDSQHSNTGWTLYHGRKVKGKVVASFLRGEPLLQDGKLVRTDGGQYLPRPVQPSVAAAR